MRHLILLAVALAATSAAPIAAQRGASARGAWHLTPDGYGPARIGMTRAQVERALGVTLEGTAIEDANVCIEMAPRAGRHRDIVFMFENRRLSRIAATDASRATSARGIGLGASAAQVRRAYGRAMRAEEHTYLGRPAEYLTVWTVPNRRGIRFVTALNRRVETIIAGNETIQYIEGCA